MGKPRAELVLHEGATVGELQAELRNIGLDVDSEGIIIALNEHGLGQWPPERRIEPEDVVLVFPYVGGGSSARKRDDRKWDAD